MALISGANRGIGLEFVRQYAAEGWRVLACCRDPDAANDLQALAARQSRVDIHRLDVADHAQIGKLAAALDGVTIDLLLNNAGVMGGRPQSFGALDYARWEETLRVNLMAPVRMAEAFVEHVAASHKRRIVSLSSRMGSIAEASGGYYLYRTSKAALDMAVKCMAADLRSRNIVAIVFHPGHVRTEMGGVGAPLTPEDSVRGMRRIIAGVKPSDSGRFFNYDGSAIPW